MRARPSNRKSDPPEKGFGWVLLSLTLFALILFLPLVLAIFGRNEAPASGFASTPPEQHAGMNPGQWGAWQESAAASPFPEMARPELAANQPITWDVLASAQEGDLISALVRQSGSPAWVRVAAVIEQEEVDGVLTRSIVGRQALAADRMEVRLQEGVSFYAVFDWLTGHGARLIGRPDEPEVYDVIWDAPDIQTLPQAVTLLATQAEWFAHVQPVTVSFDPEVFNLNPQQ